jgi:hypothetical protein
LEKSKGFFLKDKTYGFVRLPLSGLGQTLSLRKVLSFGFFLKDKTYGFVRLPLSGLGQTLSLRKVLSATKKIILFNR